MMANPIGSSKCSKTLAQIADNWERSTHFTIDKALTSKTLNGWTLIWMESMVDDA